METEKEMFARMMEIANRPESMEERMKRMNDLYETNS